MDQDESSSNSSLSNIHSRGYSSVLQQQSTLNSTPMSSENGVRQTRCTCGGSEQIGSHELISSHDTSTSHYHTKLDTWLDDLTGALHAAWPKRHIIYFDVHVLMITWEKNDIPHMEKEIDRLRSVFEDGFCYTIHQLKIPLSNSDLIMRRKVDDFISDYGGRDNLLIVYYAGHARPGTYSGAPPIWFVRDSTGTESTFDTAHIQPILARAQNDSPDVLLIYDCCHSLYARPTNNEPTRAVVECLFAGGFEAKVPTAGPDSFTTALYQELGVALDSPKPSSVADLHRKIINRLETWKPTPMFQDNKLRKHGTGKPALTKAVRTTPIHISLSRNEEPRTIFLTPKKEVSSLAETQGHQDECEDKTKDQDLPRVLLAIRIIENQDSIEELKRWILTAPSGVVRFEKIYRSYSDLLLVEVPLPVWDLLPQNPAVAFIGFTRGEKSLSSIQNLNTSVEIPMEEVPQQSQLGCEEDGLNQKARSGRMRTSSEHTAATVPVPAARSDENLAGSQSDCEQAVVEPKQTMATGNYVQTISEHTSRVSSLEQNEPGHISQESHLERTEFALASTSYEDSGTHPDEAVDISADNEGVSNLQYDDSSSSQETDNSPQEVGKASLTSPTTGKFSSQFDYHVGNTEGKLVSGQDDLASHTPEPDREHADDHPRSHPPRLSDNFLPTPAGGSAKDEQLGVKEANIEISTAAQNNPTTLSTGNVHSLGIGPRENATPFDFKSWFQNTETRNPGTRYYLPLPIAELRSFADTTATDIFASSSHTIKSRQDQSAHDHTDVANSESGTHQSSISNQNEIEDEIRGVGGAGQMTELEKYRVHSQTEFQPGRVLKIQKSGSRSTKRFIIVAIDEAGYSNCVPIRTYGREGCRKNGLNPKTHGIIYCSSLRLRPPTLLEGEPELGFAPIQMVGYKEEDLLPKESRVDYAKLVTIEHNAKVSFIGVVAREDFDAFIRAANECWEQRRSKPK
ncbi:hypothetical protein M434DRAFT_275372 [Hypoxylon sp. CO27-5]|nr:hypothetical protein M434DRAFT_275372 [Hypoxylon sp. CO27-5]